MRNLKKVLSLVLCMAMMLSVMVVGAGAAFKDQNKIVNEEAVDMCSALNIINGYTDGSYRPEGNITRAEACKMICIALNGGKEPVLGTNATATFTDIKGHWAEKYIEYCVSEGIVAGIGGGKFNPNGNVTGSQFAKMLLIGLGYNAEHAKFLGNAWEVNVNVKASEKGLYEDLETMNPAVALTRDNAAQMVWNALQTMQVKYEYTLVSNNGVLTSQVVVKDDKDAGTLLADKYGTTEATGTLTAFSYNSDKAEWTYTINNKSYTTDEDFTDLYQQDVKVIYKDKDVYGIFADDAVVMVEGVVGDIEDLDEITATTDEVTVDGVDYKLEATTGYYFGAGKIADVRDIFAKTGYEAFPFTAIDNDDNGKIDTIVVYPITVAEVTYVGSKTITAGGASYSLEDDVIYDGVAKDDWVVITKAANSATEVNEIAKAEVVSGEVTVVNGSDYTIGGEVYTLGSNVNESYLELGNEVEVVVVNGYIMAEVGLVSGTIAMDEVVYIDATEVKNSYGKDTLMAKAYFADGTSADIEIKSTNGADVVKNGKLVSGADKWATKYDLWTYELDGSKYELTAITTGNKADFDTTTSVSTAGDDRIGSLRVNDAAVIFVKDGDGDISVVTGADVKAWSKGTAVTGTVYANETSGYNYVELAALTVTGDVPGAAYDDIYGYVVATLGQTKEDNKTYSSYSVWTGSSTETIKVEASKDDNAAKGDFIKVADDKITVIKDTQEAAVKAYDGEYVTFYDSEGEFKITDDTKIIYVNTDDVAGAEGGSITEATDHNTAGTYEKNVVYLADTAAGKTDELLVLFVDVNNELAD